MNVTLSEELENFVKEKLRAGQFQSENELIGSAVALLRDQEVLTQEDVSELRREITLGLEELDRGQSARWDANGMKEKLRQHSDIRRDSPVSHAHDHPFGAK